jgi:tRNA dimethylallyltransferase
MFKTEIISADSRQFYREMNIGTAKPTHDELMKIKHHFINSLSINDDYTAGHYEKEALACLDELFKKHNKVILAGGSGLFVKAVCEGLDVLPAGDIRIRQHYEKIFIDKGLEPLQNELKEKDLEYFKTVDSKNPRRLIRALEVISQTGKPFSSLRKAKTLQRNFAIAKIGLTLDNEKLREQIDQRVDAMLASGWLQESKKLYSYRHLNALKTVGYVELFDFIDGKNDWTKTIQTIKINTWHYAKRQFTWFRKDKSIKWFSANDQETIVKYIEHLPKNITSET